MLHIRSISLPQSKEKWEDFGIAGLGLSLDVLIYIIKVWKTQIVMLMSLMFRVRCSCRYTWVNLNLKRIVSAHNPFLLTEEYHSPSRSSLPYLLTLLCLGFSSVISKENSPKCKNSANRQVFFLVLKK